jgi:hypothetical protein
MKTFTRKEYMSKVCTHKQYYAQFVTENMKNDVIRAIGKDALMNSTDEHLNDIPLKKWDRLASGVVPFYVNSAMRELGDYPTLGGLVCIAKEAARQVIAANA